MAWSGPGSAMAEIAPAPNSTVVLVRTDADVVTARETGRTTASEIGFERSNLVIVTTAISEVARNIVRYAGQGSVEIAPQRDGARLGILIVARDQGPGIEDVQRALQIGYTTGKGLGLGLPACQTLMDEFAITSCPGQGTTVMMRKWVD
jgi:serine/threonine-protein kinase RsbT